MFLLLVCWNSVQASMAEQPGVPCYEALLLVFLHPLISLHAPVQPGLIKTIQTKESAPQASGVVPGILQWGAGSSRISGEDSPSGYTGWAYVQGGSLQGAASQSGMLVAAGGDDQRGSDGNDGNKRKDMPEDKKSPYLCWLCQINGVCWQYSCCGRRVCLDCYQKLGKSPAECPCCGKSRRPRVYCDLYPSGRQLIELGQHGVINHLCSEHLYQRAMGIFNRHCQHCNEPITLYLPLQELMSALLSHCSAPCIFTDCEDILTAEADNSAHFESSHQEQAGCPVTDCRFYRFTNIRPSASHMNRHLRFSCGFCPDAFSTQQGLRAHLLTHVDSYRCAPCQGEGGEGSVLRVLLMGGQLRPCGDSGFRADLPLDSLEALMNHWASYHCLTICPFCSRTNQGCNNVAMQAHIDNNCSRVERPHGSWEPEGDEPPDLQ